jgi:hypothetical protein
VALVGEVPFEAQRSGFDEKSLLHAKKRRIGFRHPAVLLRRNMAHADIWRRASRPSELCATKRADPAKAGHPSVSSIAPAHLSYADAKSSRLNHGVSQSPIAKIGPLKCLLSCVVQDWPRGKNPPSTPELIVWSYLSHCGLHDQRPPRHWHGYDALSKLLADFQFGAASPDAIRHFVEGCYTKTAFKYKGWKLRRYAFATAIAAKLIENKQRYIQFGMLLHVVSSHLLSLWCRR